MGLWTQPVVRWGDAINSEAHRDHLAKTGELLVSCPPSPYELHPTEWFRVDDDYWLWQVGVGGIRFCDHPPEVFAAPDLNISRESFEQLIDRGWFPSVYPLWGRQVLHATAVASAEGEVLAFTGPSQAGKSTIAYGLGQRLRWQLICDDTLGFSTEPAVDRPQIVLHPLKNEARLRPASAAYYGKSGFTSESVEWPDQALRLKAIYVLTTDDSLDPVADIQPLRAAESYPLLLSQAYALTLTIPAVTQQLMRDYLNLAATAPAFRLAFRRGFDIVEQVFDLVDNHAARLTTPGAKLAAS